MFRNLLVALALSACAVTALGAQATVDTNGLSDAQVAELRAYAAAKVADAAKQADGSSVVSKDPSALMTVAATWGTQAAAAAEGFAKALSIAAKELGVTVNDFLHTDAGKLTAILIIWKVAGAAIVHILYGIVFFIVGMIITRVIYMRLFTKNYQTVEYSRFGGFFKGTKLIRVPKTIGDLQADGEWLAFWVMIGVVSATLIVTGIIIG